VSTIAAVPPLSLEEARARMLDGVAPLVREDVALADCLGRVLADALASRLTLPPWPNSAMDGFAVRAADVVAASPDAPVTLRVTGEVAAGSLPTHAVEPRTALRIMTGAPLPAGADAVVPIEDTDAAPGMNERPTMVEVYAPAPAGQHVRQAGSDLRRGDELLAAGTWLTPAALAVAAAGGHAALPVRRQPRLAVLATGDELVAAGMQLDGAKIPDSNSVGLLAQAREVGAEARQLGIARDDLAAVLELLESALDWADVVVVSGGVSVGARDVVKDAFARLGRLDLWRIAIQPGKPVAYALAERAGRPPARLFGLPGNPVAALVTFELLVRPVVRALLGLSDLSGRETVRAQLTESVTKSADRRAFLRVRLGRSPDGAWQASLAGGQGSHVLSALAHADGLAVVPEGVPGLPAGSEVDVIRIGPRGA
jgi:molybdopterin molybdotransferase